MVSVTALLESGEDLLKDPVTYANKAQILLSAAADSALQEDQRRAALRALSVFFSDVLQRGDIAQTRKKAVSKQAVAALEAHRTWLQNQLARFREVVCQTFAEGAPPAVQVTALTAVFDLSKGTAAQPCLPESLTLALEVLLASKQTATEVFATLFEHFLRFTDVRYYVFKAIHRIASRANLTAGKNEAGYALSQAARSLVPEPAQVSLEQLCRNLHAVLAEARPLAAQAAGAEGRPAGGDEPAEPPQASWCGALEAGAIRAVHAKEGSQKLKKRRRLEGDGEGNTKVGAKWATPFYQTKAFSDAWLGFLCLPLPEGIYRKVLVRLHDDVIPHLANPHLLAGPLSGALEAGGLVGMLALHAIFVLVTRHGLEYPAFYARLYSLLQGDVFFAKQRSRFFQLADIFLSSSLVPAYTVAAFVKRFARLALFAPPHGAMICLAFVHNLLRRHPACLVLIDREPAEGQGSPGDPYDGDATDPAQSRALESSLWEVQSLCSHFFPQVAALASQILEKDLGDRRKTAECDLRPLLAGSCTGLSRSELARRVRQVPTAAYARAPETLFAPEEAKLFGQLGFA